MSLPAVASSPHVPAAAPYCCVCRNGIRLTSACFSDGRAYCFEHWVWHCSPYTAAVRWRTGKGGAGPDPALVR